jgi:hypothetical protein
LNVQSCEIVKNELPKLLGEDWNQNLEHWLCRLKQNSQKLIQIELSMVFHVNKQTIHQIKHQILNSAKGNIRDLSEVLEHLVITKHPVQLLSHQTTVSLANINELSGTGYEFEVAVGHCSKYLKSQLVVFLNQSLEFALEN